MLYRNTVQHCTNFLTCSNKIVCTASAVTWPVVTITKPLNSINSKKKWKWNGRRTDFFSFKHSAPGLSGWRRMKNFQPLPHCAFHAQIDTWNLSSQLHHLESLCHLRNVWTSMHCDDDAAATILSNTKWAYWEFWLLNPQFDKNRGKRTWVNELTYRLSDWQQKIRKLRLSFKRKKVFKLLNCCIGDLGQQNTKWKDYILSEWNNSETFKNDKFVCFEGQDKWARWNSEL